MTWRGKMVSIFKREHQQTVQERREQELERNRREMEQREQDIARRIDALDDLANIIERRRN